MKVSPLVVIMVSLSPFTSIVSTLLAATMSITWLMGISREPPSGSENSVKKMAMTATIMSR